MWKCEAKVSTFSGHNQAKVGSSTTTEHAFDSTAKEGVNACCPQHHTPRVAEIEQVPPITAITLDAIPYSTTKTAIVLQTTSHALRTPSPDTSNKESATYHLLVRCTAVQLLAKSYGLVHDDAKRPYVAFVRKVRLHDRFRRRPPNRHGLAHVCLVKTVLCVHGHAKIADLKRKKVRAVDGSKAVGGWVHEVS
jgi:hypothetical protein